MKFYDVCIIGAGPAGIAAAMEISKSGLSVVLVESGTEENNSSAQQLSDAEISTENSHNPMNISVRRGLGGTSALWGGRCVPLDPVDFEKRDFVTESGWPFTADELNPFYQRACELLAIGDANFDTSSCTNLKTNKKLLSEKFNDTETILATELERWSTAPNIWLQHKAEVTSQKKITLLSDVTCVGFRQSILNGVVSEAFIRPTAYSAESGKLKPKNIKAQIFILACGGVESTRLILNSLQDPSGLKLVTPRLVGRYYMGHPSGKIADIELAGDPNKTLYGFEIDGGVYVRRRITINSKTLKKENILNISFWLDNSPISEWQHGSGVLSAAYLALTIPFLNRFLAPPAIRKRLADSGRAKQRGRHLWNCLRSPLKTIIFCIRFSYQRYFAKPRLPGFFTFNSNNRYALHYHAEQIPNWNSTITLSEKKDSHGLNRAKISLEWSRQDITSIIRAHDVLDKSLRDSGTGRLIYRYPVTALEQAVYEQAVDGLHQIGTLRMSADPTTGVTNSDGMLYGTSNFFVASSAIFPTSGQANPTLALVALAIRQAHHIVASISPDHIDRTVLHA